MDKMFTLLASIHCIKWTASLIPTDLPLPPSFPDVKSKCMPSFLSPNFGNTEYVRTLLVISELKERIDTVFVCKFCLPQSR